MSKISFWRKVGVLVTATVMAILLTACNGPSEKKAEELALQVTTALYAGNSQPMIDNLDYSQFDAIESAVIQEKAAGKVDNVLKIQMALAERAGGVDTIKVSEIKVNGDIYDVNMLVTFKDGSNRQSNMPLRWDKNLNKFVIVSK